MNKRDVLFTGFEFQQKLQRGIYLYTKSLINAVKAKGHGTGILSEAPGFADPAPLLSGIYQYINNPTRFRPGRKGLALNGLKYALGARRGTRVENRANMITEENLWFLRDVDSFLNIPRFYEMANLTARLRGGTLALTEAGRAGYDTVFTTSPFNVRHERKGGGLKLVQTLHDLIPINVTLHQERPEVFYGRLKAVAESDLILAVSHHTKQEFLQFFPHCESRIRVVYQPIPADEHMLALSSYPQVQSAVLAKFNLKPGQYCFYVGQIEARKNVHRAVAAYGLANRGLDIPFVLAGGVDRQYVQDAGMASLFSKKGDGAKSADGRYGGAMYLGYISEVEKLCLLRNARAFVFPTLSEGFGIPVLEAQTLGCPVITTETASLPEVVGDSAMLVKDPYNIEEVAQAIRKVLEDGEQCRQLSAAGHENARRFDKTVFADDVDRLLAEL
ncbi:Glycogen synthase [Pigmentiphaga humi]|uniref:Glycogen synthase n=1 Tax=Pigmentiphaga humi TaxID=2478468 RepID=A0A3P4B1L1_9BURK|nr:glycosyltransferase family 1 protein [Pigmentiphaga humi]VCU69466.1 Glycogen synthase [Pigmentiphaga humi]